MRIEVKSNWPTKYEILVRQLFHIINFSMIFQNLPLLLFLLSTCGVFQVQTAFYQEIYNIPTKYQKCSSSPCKMWNGANIPSCPSGTLTYTDVCKQSLSTCSGIWPELTYTSDRYPLCKNTKTGCWELLNQNGNWECEDPRINSCPLTEVGVSLKMVGNNWVCENQLCPEDFALQKPYRDPYYKCTKRQEDSLCPGDGDYVKENMLYVCTSPTCDLIKKGSSYYCPADPHTCEDISLQPSGTTGGWPNHWYCKNPIKTFNIEDFMPYAIILGIGLLALLLFCVQKYRAKKVETALYSHTNSFSQYQAPI